MNKEYERFINQQSELPYYKNIVDFLDQEIKNNKTIYPSKENRFNAFELTPFENVKVVIFGQDPYHSVRQADGLAFSTKESKTPKSLANIFKELKSEYHDITLSNNDLTPWVQQGVLLMNTSLSVEEGKPNSHAKIGWNIFIHNFIQFLNKEKEFLIFVLWGNNAKKLEEIICDKFAILKSSHPSPFSANKGFFGNNHFKKINEILTERNLKNIDWNLKSKETH
ncbi:MAG: uracil-DNA glycosylase [Mycoplasmataceae bacterium]|nr:uracil-DNA glycosylase [Mycoplasmataceae bacterium]